MAKVMKVVIDIDGKLEDGKLALSVEEAKNLKKLLDELFKDNKEIIYTPYPYPVYPYYPYDITVAPYKITCLGGNSSSSA